MYIYIYKNIECVIMLIMLSSIICLSARLSEAPASKSGPFTARLISAAPCSPRIKPTKPYDKNPFCKFYMEIYNTTNKNNLVRGNFTVLRQPNMKDLLRFRGYQWRDGKWQIKYNFNNIACNGLLRNYMIKIVGMDEFQNCNYPKGVWVFEGLDYNLIDHMIWSKGREYGRMLWVVEVFSRTGTQFCMECETVVEPA